jgi:hypothetical protein
LEIGGTVKSIRLVFALMLSIANSLVAACSFLMLAGTADVLAVGALSATSQRYLIEVRNPMGTIDKSSFLRLICAVIFFPASYSLAGRCFEKTAAFSELHF